MSFQNFRQVLASLSAEAEIIETKVESYRKAVKNVSTEASPNAPPNLDHTHRNKSSAPGVESAAVDLLQKRVALFLKRQEHAVVKQVFDRYADSVQHLIFPEQLQQALEEMGVQIKAEEVHALIQVTDMDNNGGLDFEEFQRALMKPPTKVRSAFRC